MPTLVHYLPIVTTLFCIPFSITLYKHWRRKPEVLYLFWWFVGVAMYGVGTLTESLTTLIGWQPWIFKSWYISGALMGGAPLAQGSIYLLMKTSRAHKLAIMMVSVIAVASVCVLLSPIDMTHVESYRLSGSVLGWQWVRAFSPFINVYALIFLVGGAFWSAWKYRSAGPEYRSRYTGNILIAVGALLPGIGGTMTRFGYVEALYVTEILGIICIWLGYRQMLGSTSSSIIPNQIVAEAVPTTQHTQ